MTVEQRSKLDSLMTIRHNAYVKAKQSKFRDDAEEWREANRTYVEYRDSLLGLKRS
jgi:hypothetical protein